MTTRAARAWVAATAAALLLLPLTACTSTEPAADEPPASTREESAPAEEGTDEAASGETYGCTEEMIAHATEYGYPAAVPLDPATLDIPLISFDITPDCYLIDEETGAVRHAAFWATDPQGVVTALGEDLSAAGYVQSDDYGPYIWWFNGDEPIGAEHGVGAAPQPVGGTEMLWATW
jgi:hypothetical protein